jgi:uncharacterized membrane protein YeaQ/YmgE (transglycosylase-associated protein family)
MPEDENNGRRAGGQRNTGVAGEGRRIMTLGMFLLWIGIGLLTGWVAQYVSRQGGYGLIGDISLGAIGSLVGSGLFLFLGMANPSLAVSVVVAALGATVLIFAQHAFWAAPA